MKPGRFADGMAVERRLHPRPGRTAKRPSPNTSSPQLDKIGYQFITVARSAEFLDMGRSRFGGHDFAVEHGQRVNMGRSGDRIVASAPILNRQYPAGRDLRRNTAKAIPTQRSI